MKLQAFNGGLNTRVSPRHIRSNEAVVCTNVDVESQELVSCKGLGSSEASAVVAPYYFEADDEWVDSADTRDYLEYKGALYWTGDDGLTERKQGIDTKLGLPSPSTADFIGEGNFGLRTTLDPELTDLFGYTPTFPFYQVQQAVTTVDLVNLPYTGVEYDSALYDDTVYTLAVQVYVDGKLFSSVTIQLSALGDLSVFDGLRKAIDMTSWVAVQNPPPDHTIKIGLHNGSGFVNLPDLTFAGAWPGVIELLPTYDSTEAGDNLPPYSDVADNVVPINSQLLTETPDTWGASPTSYAYLVASSYYSTSQLVFSTYPNLYGFTQEGGNWLKADYFGKLETGILGTHRADTLTLHAELDNYGPMLPNNIEFVDGGTFRYATRKTFTIRDFFDADPTNTAVPYIQSGVSPFQGTVAYLYTYYDTLTGAESLPSALTQQITIAAAGEVAALILDLQETLEPSIVVRLYRVGAGLLEYTLVEELAAVSQVHFDMIATADVAGGLLPTDVAGLPPSDLRHLTRSSGMFFGAIGEILRFTDVYGNIAVWKETHYLDFEVPITGLSDSTSGLVVFTRYKTYLVTGNSPATLSRQLLSGDQGCIAHKTIVQRGNTLLFWSTDGICTLSGSALSVLSKPLVGVLAEAPTMATLHNEVYYSVLSDRILAVDLRYGVILVTYEFDLTWLAVGNDVLYGVRYGEKVPLFAGPLTTYKYRTGQLTEGATTEIKLYHTVYVACEGSHAITIYIDGNAVVTASLTGTRQPEAVAIPKEYQRGTSIEFELTGTGTVMELEYKVEGRRNGR